MSHSKNVHFSLEELKKPSHKCLKSKNKVLVDIIKRNMAVLNNRSDELPECTICEDFAKVTAKLRK